MHASDLARHRVEAGRELTDLVVAADRDELLEVATRHLFRRSGDLTQGTGDRSGKPEGNRNRDDDGENRGAGQPRRHLKPSARDRLLGNGEGEVVGGGVGPITISPGLDDDKRQGLLSRWLEPAPFESNRRTGTLVRGGW